MSQLADTIAILTLLCGETHLTGSVAYGLPNPKDEDRFCTRATFDRLYDLLSEAGVGVKTNDGADGSGGTRHAIWFDLCGTTYNVFVVPDDEVALVRTVTMMVESACSLYPAAGADKPLRVHMFRTFRDTLVLWKSAEQSKAKAGEAPPCPIGR